MDSTKRIALPTGITLNVRITTTRQPAGDQTLLLLHFWGGSHRTWHRVIDQLREKHNIIAPSLRGAPGSSSADNYHIADHAEDIAGLLEHLGHAHPELVNERGIVVVGHSMGGKIAQYLLTTRLRGLIRGLVLVDPAPASGFALPHPMKEQQLHAYDSLDSARSVISNVLLSSPTAVSASELEALVEDAVSWSPEAKAAWPGYAMAEELESDVVAALGEKEDALPVLVVVGQDDRVETPQNVEQKVVRVLEKAGVDLKIESFEGVGHLLPVEAAESLSRAIDLFVNTL